MPKIYVRYVTWVSRRRRHHGDTKIDVIPPPPPGNQMPGDTVPLPAPSLVGWNDAQNKPHTGTFAFWSIVGASNGAYVSTNLSETASIGSQDVHATAFYIEGGGTGPGEPGVWIDAFDVAFGDFVDDDFVTVTPDDAGKTLTALANNDGFLNTNNSAETAHALNAIHGVPFSKWQVVLGPETAVGKDLSAGLKTVGVAFAFFQVGSGPGGPKIDPSRYAEVVKIIFGVIQDGGGLTDHGPVGPWDPLLQRLIAGLAQAQMAQGLDVQFRADALGLAARQVRDAAAKLATKIEASAKTG